jgi:hypothetical protein
MAHYLLARYQQHAGAAAEALQLLDQTLVGETHPPSVQLRLLRARCMVLLYEGKVTELALSADMYLQPGPTPSAALRSRAPPILWWPAHASYGRAGRTLPSNIAGSVLQHSHTTYHTTFGGSCLRC